MAARECWIYGKCLKIQMMVPGAAAPGKHPVNSYQLLQSVILLLCLQSHSQLKWNGISRNTAPAPNTAISYTE